MRKKMLAVLLFGASATVGAKDIEVQASCNGAPCQAAFESVAADLVALIDYRAMGPAEATGLTGIGIGVVGGYVPVDDKGRWRQVTNTDFSGLPLVGVQVTKGLVGGIDLGAFYSTVPGTNVDLYGGEMRYAFLEGSAATPALALRGSYVALTGSNSIDLDSTGLELALSKGFGPITPYVGVGYVWGSAEAPSNNLEAKVEDAKANIGVRLSLGLLEVTPQVGQVGDIVTYALRLGVSL